MNSVKKNQNPAFKGATFVNLSALDKNQVTPVIAEFKKILGQGISQKTYKIGCDKFVQDVFVSYNKVKNPFNNDDSCCVFIATGDDLNIGKRRFAKMAAIDDPILRKINQVLKKFNLTNNPSVGVVKSSLSERSGYIMKIGDNKELEILVSHKFVNALDKDSIARTGTYYSEDKTVGRNLAYGYSRNNKGAYEYLNTIAL